ncbi:class I SAM-dependent methyltransferase [Candidatus Margulisiibacteriota bacterium]
MKTEDIRPESLMQEGARLDAEDLQLILKHKFNFVEGACPACESKDYRLDFEKNGFEFVLCNNCSTLYINPRPTYDMLSEFYKHSKNAKFWNDKIYPLTEAKRRDQIYAPKARRVIELCKAHKASADSFLDVGAGSGVLCEEITRLGFFKKVTALEPFAHLANTCRQKNLNVIEKSIEEAELSDFSVITNFEVIEHLYWPKDLILNCRKALADEGLFILTTPNINGFDLAMLGKLSDNIGGPHHLNYFNAESLAHLLGECGFKVVEVLTPGELDAEIVRNKILSGELDISGDPFLRQVLISRWEQIGGAFQEFLAKSQLSSHLWLVAKKCKS